MKKLREVRKRKRLGEDGERSGDEESKKAATVSDRRATSPISSIMSLVEEYFRGLLVVYFLRRKEKELDDVSPNRSYWLRNQGWPPEKENARSRNKYLYWGWIQCCISLILSFASSFFIIIAACL